MVNAIKINTKKRYITPRTIYQLSPDEYMQIKKILMEMYSQWPTVDDADLKAEETIRRCCEAKTVTGKLWRNAPDELERRFLIFGFDYTNMKPVDGFYEARVTGGKLGVKNEGKKAGVIPKEMRIESKVGSAVGSSSLVSTEEQDDVKKKYRQLLKELPHLDNNITRDDVMMLAKLYVIADRVTNFALVHGKLPTNVNFDSAILTNIERLKKSLNIDINSLNRDRDNLDDGSVAQLVREFYDYIDDDNFWLHEVELYLEELAMLLRKHDRADENGMPEINEVVFKQLSGGLSAEEAHWIISNPYAPSVDDLIDQAKKFSAEKQAAATKKQELFVKRMSRSYAKDRVKARYVLRALGYSEAEVSRLVPHKRLLRGNPK